MVKRRTRRRSGSSGRPAWADRCTVALLLALLILFPSCADKDPRAGVLEERGRWDVQVLSWAPTESGSVHISTRLSGPRAAKLQSLTVRFELQDGSGSSLGDQWHVFDLSDVPHGGPKDFSVIITDAPQGVEQVGMDRVYEPDADQEALIRELQF